MNVHEKINYIEFPSQNIKKTKGFFESVFNWSFENFWPDYIAFSNEWINGWFYKSDQCTSTKNWACLIVFFSNDILSTQSKIEKAGGTIIKPLFTFPWGSRFHFTDTNNNEYGVWTDKS